MGISNNDLLVIAMAALLSAPGLYALYKGLHKDLEETNLHLQLESYANEIRRLQALVDEQQRKINEMMVQIASLRSKSSAIGKAAKRLAEQLRVQNVEPVVDADKLIEILEKE